MSVIICVNIYLALVAPSMERAGMARDCRIVMFYLNNDCKLGNQSAQPIVRAEQSIVFNIPNNSSNHANNVTVADALSANNYLSKYSPLFANGDRFI
jgi:uncharacterized repeat protein (TIGR01451 family)